jgi:hypothetical protein
MMIDPRSHLLLHRQEQHERERHLGHRAAIRATQERARVIASTGLSSGRRRGGSYLRPAGTRARIVDLLILRQGVRSPVRSR